MRRVLTLHNMAERVMVICGDVTLLSSMYEGIMTFNIFLYALCLLSYTFLALIINTKMLLYNFCSDRPKFYESYLTFVK